MEEIIVSKEELIEMFESEKIVDTGKGWYMDNSIVDIVALHEIEPKFLQDIANAKLYKIIKKKPLY
ncbi:hypothetical protein ACN2EN_06895 [Aliarcobacter lanthieri]|uniref:hypothetical protein n=1 Tax=Aliarcobacter lanthieri TaxID=1355374 RepID=UPI00047DC3E4|nr:hypothetical protein [Aliarcobacter lanthieri]QKF59454.1 hypothetical protein ALANTH_1347 [Aliarcobacter lanthieri]